MSGDRDAFGRPLDGPAPGGLPPAPRPDAPRPVRGYGDGPVPPGAFAPPPPRPIRWDAGPTPPALASWGRRVLAAIVDGIIVALIAALLLVPAFAVGVSFSAGGDDTGGLLAFVIAVLVGVSLAAVASIVYAPLMLWRTDGRTVGKRLAGIRVVRADGRPIGLGTALAREVVVKQLLVGLLASVTFGLAWLADVLWPLRDPERRALHDFPTDTRVVVDA